MSDDQVTLNGSALEAADRTSRCTGWSHILAGTGCVDVGQCAVVTTQGVGAALTPVTA